MTNIYDVLTQLNIHMDGDLDNALNHMNDRVREHTERVMACAFDLAIKYGLDSKKVKRAAMLHDISGIVPSKERIKFCHLMEIPLLLEEIDYPILSHQKISRVIAEKIYGIHDEMILSAIECHTTLKASPSQVDLVVFIADKLEWDQDGEPPYKDLVLKGLKTSLEMGALNYINYMLESGRLLKPHTWLLEAQAYLEKKETFMIPGVGGIIEKEGCLLIQKRCKKDAPSEYGLYEIPAGKIRAGENIFDCLRREILEETGLNLTMIEGESESQTMVTGEYHVVNYTPFSNTQNMTLHYPIMVQVFICHATGELVNGTNESQDLSWMSLDELEALLEDVDRLYPMHIHTLTKYLKHRRYDS